MTRSRTTIRKNVPTKRFTIRLLAGLIVVVVLLGVLELLGVIHVFHHDTSAVSAGSETKGEPMQSNSKSSLTPDSGGSPTGGITTTPSSDNNKSVSNSGSTATLLAPIGNFVSNHHPSLSDASGSNSMSSVCTTTPGASCTITFTKGGLTKSLTSEVTDSNGSAYWNWNLQVVGLTVGTWQVQAVATLSGQTKTATDANSLVISP